MIEFTGYETLTLNGLINSIADLENAGIKGLDKFDNYVEEIEDITGTKLTKGQTDE